MKQLEQIVIHGKENGPEPLRQQRPTLTTTREDRAMDYRPLPPVDYLRDCFLYDPLDGSLTWRVRPRSMFQSDKGWRIANTKFAGTPALHCKSKHGYTGRVPFDGEVRSVKAARVIYAVHHGRQPDGFIDHINGNCFDNRAVNLRVVSKQENCLNRARPRHGSRPHQGVFSRRDKWCASIRFRGHNYWLGTYETEKEAIAARKEAERRFGFHKNHGRNRVNYRDAA